MTWVGSVGTKARLLAISSAICLASACTDKAPSVRAVEPAPHVNSSSGFRTLVYSEVFAKHFGLPRRGVDALPNGVQAVALGIAEHPEVGAICALDLYLDDGFDFAFPPGTEGSFDAFRAGARSALGFFASLQDDTTELPLEQRFREPRAVFRSANLNAKERRGEYHVLPVDAFYREVAPHTNLVSFEPGCSLLSESDVEAWLLRSGQSPAALTPATTPDTSAAQRISLPTRLLRHAQTALKNAAKRQESGPPQRASEENEAPYTLP